MATYTVTIDERSEQGKKVLSFLRSSEVVTIRKARKTVQTVPEVDKETEQAFLNHSRRSVATR
jgi:uncharacterized protein (DUF169 family)